MHDEHNQSLTELAAAAGDGDGDGGELEVSPPLLYMITPLNVTVLELHETAPALLLLLPTTT